MTERQAEYSSEMDRKGATGVELPEKVATRLTVEYLRNLAGKLEVGAIRLIRYGIEFDTEEFPDETGMAITYRHTNRRTFKIVYDIVGYKTSRDESEVKVNIQEAKKRKGELERQITALLHEFSDETGLAVRDVRVTPYETFGGEHPVVDVTVEL